MEIGHFEWPQSEAERPRAEVSAVLPAVPPPRNADIVEARKEGRIE
jgi:hypothetical protein